ncbi:NAD-dependent epimerase/dehydratase family protein [Catenovulum adriaticum]|uniref:NAD-dependent epimerase/dehydratase family protein n=1 Tax=Catenovulum adriaticum TaxID=2984846 RepID=A0ABY7AMA5_9ALTE|nr:NAD-dependent epimerase/dehydratase family protein [Catenovulum sp. TS8]WAJ69796.1 NAD-dependent epimerase/dehydratase family protein [Catenovulum sp. TS8]
MINISVLGAGWLGLPLALSLKQAGNKVKVSHSSEQACEKTRLQGLDAHVCKLGDTFNITQSQALFESDILIVTIPPGFRQATQGKDFLIKWRQIINSANASGIQKIIMTSSTGVYPDNNQMMREEDACAHNEKAKILLSAEQLLQSEFKGEYLVVRLGGLFGGNRHPARFVKHMKKLNSEAIANMLHLDDAVGAICYLIEKQATNQIFNIVSPKHPTKAVFYQTAIRYNDENLNMPQIMNGDSGKCISSDKLLTIGYCFIYPNPCSVYQII